MAKRKPGIFQKSGSAHRYSKGSIRLMTVCETKSFTGLGKNDGIDSLIVVDYARAGLIEIEPWRGGAQYLALQRLTR